MRAILWLSRSGATRSPRPSPTGGETPPPDPDVWLVHGVQEVQRVRGRPLRLYFFASVHGLPLFEVRSGLCTGMSPAAEFLSIDASRLAGWKVDADCSGLGPIEHLDGRPVWVQYLGQAPLGVLPGAASAAPVKEENAACRVARVN